MKAVITIIVLLCVVFILFGTLGAPQYTSDANGASFYTSGTTIFDSWNEAARQRTERTRIIEAEETARKTIAEEQATIRNRDFWNMAPYFVMALALLAVAVGVAIWLWKRDGSAPMITVTVNRLQAPPDLRRFARTLPIDAEYIHNGTWWVVDAANGEVYEPPPHLARLPGPHNYQA